MTTTETIKQAAEKAREENRPLAILFVCLGNICRSPAAEGVMRKLADERPDAPPLKLDSCGFYGGHAGDLPDRRMRVAGLQRGYTFDHRSRTIRPSDFDDFDLIFGMDDSNIADLHDAARTLDDEKKILRMADLAIHYPEWHSVPDPYYEGAEGFYLVLKLLEDACENLLNIITPKE